MHTLEQLERSLELAERMGYAVRQEWLGGIGGGACHFGGRQYIFVDLALSVAEQLDQVTAALRNDPTLDSANPPAALAPLLGLKRAA
jgi:hypothetical protein